MELTTLEKEKKKKKKQIPNPSKKSFVSLFLSWNGLRFIHRFGEAEPPRQIAVSPGALMHQPG